MKKGILTKMAALSLVATLILPVSLHAETAVKSPVGGNTTEISYDNDIELKKQLEDNVNNFETVEHESIKKIDENSIQLHTENVSPLAVDRKTRGSVAEVHNSVQDYLTAVEDQKVYGIQIEPGVLLQAELQQPNYNTMDYDLYLFDSTGSNILDYSENYCYVNSDYRTCPEGVGIINTSNDYQTYYLMVRSSAGGSTTSPYTLRYSVSYPFDSFEADENPTTAKKLNLTSGGLLVNSRNISSPVDVDWYQLNIPSKKNYDQITFSMGAIAGNQNKLELFQDATGSNKMYLIGSVNSGGSMIKALAAGTYYIRISYKGTDGAYDSNNVNNYSLRVAPILKVTGISITNYYSGEPNSGMVHYPQGYYYRAPGSIQITGVVFSEDPATGTRYAMPNQNVMVQLIDNGVRERDIFTDENGQFQIRLSFGNGIGEFSDDNYVTTVYYDLVMVQAYLMKQPDIKTQGYVYHIVDIII